MKTAAQAASRWQTNASGAQQAYSDGVQQTQVDVVGRAVAQAGAMIQGVQQAVTSGRWQAGLQRVGNAGWKAAVAKKASNYGTGIAAGSDKYAAAAAKLIPFLESQTASLPARVPGDVAGNINRRLLPLAQSLHQAKGQFKG